MIYPETYAYLASPYSKYPAGIEAAFKDICVIAGTLLKQGHRVYSPIAHTHPIAIHAGIDPYDLGVWLPFDKAMMDHADHMIIAKMDGWDVSSGIKHEIAVFTLAGKPIYFYEPNTGKIIDFE